MRSAKEERQLYATPIIAWFLPIVTGLFAGILVATPVSLVTWRYFEDTRPFWTFTITAAIVALVVWYTVLSWVFRKLDLLPDGRELPAYEEVTTNDGRTIKRYAFDTISQKDFNQIALTVLDGGDLTYRSLDPILGSKAGAFKDELVRKNLAQWKDPYEHRSGMVLTRAGWSVFRNHDKDLNLSPTPEVE